MNKKNLACIIDDDPIHIYVTKEEIVKTGLFETISSYKNGKEAYDKLNEIHQSGGELPDLILLDLNMPIWDGWDFLDEFLHLKIEKKISIFIISSSNDPADLQKSKKYKKVNNFVVKPVTSDQLMTEIRKLN